ncbi:hypothetical protein F4802DRAFT_253752 [Xylaria palmicola]|nr:hypothetical protein F4802DRAFT_253752 [Xylaria palmicola]
MRGLWRRGYAALRWAFLLWSRGACDSWQAYSARTTTARARKTSWAWALWQYEPQGTQDIASEGSHHHRKANTAVQGREDIRTAGISLTPL